MTLWISILLLSSCKVCEFPVVLDLVMGYKPYSYSSIAPDVTTAPWRVIEIRASRPSPIENAAPKLGDSGRKREEREKLIDPIEDDCGAGRRSRKALWRLAEPRCINNDNVRREAQHGVRRPSIRGCGGFGASQGWRIGADIMT
jgi:hypothetical protein